MQCTHQKNFEAHVGVQPCSTREDGPVDGWMAEVTIKCAECGTPFHFKGTLQGCSFIRPMTGPGGTELRIPIGPGPLGIDAHHLFEMPRKVEPGTVPPVPPSIPRDN